VRSDYAMNFGFIGLGKKEKNMFHSNGDYYYCVYQEEDKTAIISLQVSLLFTSLDFYMDANGFV